MTPPEAPKHTDNREDNELVKAYQEGDRSAFQALYNCHRERVFRFCLHMVRNREDALDITQDIFCGLIKSLHQYEAKAKFTTWLYRVTKNRCYDFLRKNIPIPIDNLGDAPSVQTALTVSERRSETDMATSIAITIDTAEAIQHLDPKHRDVIILHYIEDYSYDEIADKLEVAVGTVKSRLARARAKLVDFFPDPGNLTPTSSRPSSGDIRG